MGFRTAKKTITLRFEEPELEGLEIRAASATVGEVIDYTHMAEAIEKANNDEKVDSFSNLLDLFATKLIGWNLEEENGDPIPATREGLRSLDLELARDIAKAWLQGVIGVSTPLPKPSTTGERALLGSETMEPLPESLNSSTTPS